MVTKISGVKEIFENGEYMGIEQFKNKYFQYYNSIKFPTSKMKLLKNALNKALEEELPLRDKLALIIIRDFANSHNLKINVKRLKLACRYDKKEKTLLIGTVGPAWNRGWNGISGDKVVSDQINRFFYFANQYIHRSMQINLIGAIALTFNLDCDFKGHTIHEIIFPYGISKYEEFWGSVPMPVSQRNHRLIKYLDLINSLDPYVNKAIYYFTRALSLRRDGFHEEAITALDNMVDTIFQSIKERLQLPTMQRKDMSCYVMDQLHVSNGVLKSLTDLYQLRCSFSAHPAHSNWWDFYEIYDQDIEAIMSTAKLFLIKYFLYEKQHRIIDNNPEKWSQWFYNHCDTVLDAVWFHHLPPLYRN